MAAVGHAVLCMLYIALNAALNFANRWALGVHGFGFPLVLTTAHMMLNPVLLLPLMLLSEAYRGKHAEIFCGHWRALLVIAAFNGIQIALNNSSLVHIELSMNQVVRATMPVVVALFELFRGTAPTRLQFPPLMAIAIGVMFVVYQPSSRSAEWWGTLLVASSISLQAAQMSFAGSLLSLKLDSFQITFYTSPMAMLTLAGPAAFVEGGSFHEYLMANPSVTACVIVGTCLLAVVYNVVMFQTIHRMGPVGSAVLGNVKIVVLLVLSSLLMGEMKQWEVRQYLGCVLTFAGAAAYSALKLKRPAAQAPYDKKGE